MITKEIQTTDMIQTKNMRGSNVDALLSYVLKLWARDRKQILGEFGLTIPQYEALSAISFLSNHKKEIIQTDLAKETKIDPMNISTILRNLERNKLITRIRGTVDTRVINIELTELGKLVFQQASTKMSSSYNNLYKNIDEKNLTIQLIKLSNVLNAEAKDKKQAAFYI